jgi:hypothetical protein
MKPDQELGRAHSSSKDGIHSNTLPEFRGPLLSARGYRSRTSDASFLRTILVAAILILSDKT